MSHTLSSIACRRDACQQYQATFSAMACSMADLDEGFVELRPLAGIVPVPGLGFVFRTAVIVGAVAASRLFPGARVIGAVTIDEVRNEGFQGLGGDENETEMRFAFAEIRETIGLRPLYPSG